MVVEEVVPTNDGEGVVAGEEKEEVVVGKGVGTEEEETAQPATDPAVLPKDTPLVLTSEKRRGVYECDYCHSDISQLPRIRCAVCPDFDLCLDCFATTDHNAAIARLKAAATAHSELSKDGIESTLVAGISSTNHDHTHGYRVCDSTRYPICSSARNAQELKATGTTVPASNGGGDGSSDSNELATNNAERKRKSDETDTTTTTTILVVSEDPRGVWTAEEDLRLLDAIKTHGLGNWADISEAVGGNGSNGKTPKRCMERYFDDFLGRYGHILPPYTILDDDVDDETYAASVDGDSSSKQQQDDEEAVRVSKRIARMPSNLTASSAGGSSSRSRKRFKVVRTESLPGYDKIWPKPYLPPVPGVEIGQEVARDIAAKSELSFVKATAAAATKEEADKIRKEWMETRMDQLGAPTVLPPRPEDTALLPGANLMGFMPRRGDFDVEWENDAEQAIADMEFTQGDSPQDRQLKLKVLDIYYQKQEEREKRKKFIMSRKLYDYKRFLENEETIPTDERDLRYRLRLFERFHTPEEHSAFIADILKAKRLRKEIAKLQMYRRIGIRSLLEAEKYELDKERRQFHKVAQIQKEAEAKLKASAANSLSATSSTAASASGATAAATMEPVVDSLWKQYRSSDRKARRSINRTGDPDEAGDGVQVLEKKYDDTKGEKQTEDIEMKDNNNKKEGSETGKEERDKSEDVEMDDATDAQQSGDEKPDKGTSEKEGSPSKDETSETGKNGTQEEKTSDGEEFDIRKSQGFDLLSHKEVALCTRLKLLPLQYLEIKKALIHESLKNGLLDKEGAASTKRMIVKVDVEKRGNIVDFMVRAGWISNSLAKVARTVTPPVG